MANPEHLKLLQSQDARTWNQWRLDHPAFIPDLLGATLTEAVLRHRNLQQADLRGADLRFANLRHTDLNHAHLEGALLDWSDLTGSIFSFADLSGATLKDSKLIGADLNEALLQSTFLDGSTLRDVSVRSTNFERCQIGYTIFADVDLASAQNLNTVSHKAPSEITVSTIYKSKGNIPEVFLRGCGVPETMIMFAKSLVGKPIQYYSAFISYSSQDEMFARRLHNDLQMNGVRVWFAPEDLKIGEMIEDSIDQAIRVYDKLILVLSKNSIERAWVRKEFSQAIKKEQQHGKTVLFPIRLDDSVFDTAEQWAYDIHKRHIGDFRNWENPLLYQNALNRLLRDLNAND